MSSFVEMSLDLFPTDVEQMNLILNHQGAPPVHTHRQTYTDRDINKHILARRDPSRQLDMHTRIYYSSRLQL